MSDVLAKLYGAKAKVLAEEQVREPYETLVERAQARRAERRSFTQALRAADGPAIVAEIKRASPSAGLIARNFDPVKVSANYERAGADAISVLTETDHFLGDIAYLEVARAHSSRPVLRKDFLTSPYQVVQSAAYGADAVLLIAAGLRDPQIQTLMREARAFDLDVLIEVHDEEELVRAIALKPDVLGINNRDLRTFDTDLGTTEYLMPHVPAGLLVMSESGVGEPEEVAALHALGAHAFLVGQALMLAEDPIALVRALKGSAVAR